MIKFAAITRPKDDPDAPPEVLMGIILSWANLDRLREGKPIKFDFAELNENMPPDHQHFPNGQVLIAADEDEETTLREFTQRGITVGQFIDNKTPHEAELVLAEETGRQVEQLSGLELSPSGVSDIRTALGLMRSMILSGEKMSPVSEEAIEKALALLR